MSNSALPTSVRRRALAAKEDCPMAQAAELLGDRWTLLILREAFYGVQRYDDMRADTQAPRSMLTDRLTKLVASGMLERRPYQEEGDRVRNGYALTEKGRDLAFMLLAMKEWGEKHVIGTPGPVAIVEAGTGKELRLGLFTKDGRRVELSKTKLTKRI